MDASAEDTRDPRLRAYCDPSGPEVFHAVAHRQDIWREDPFDVEHIHAEARETFQRLVNQGLDSDHRESGRILLLKGEAGAGKTHLMRAFRSYLHRRGEGYFGYMQMSTLTDNYSRYMLRNLIDSLEKPYWESAGPQTGLMRLSNALVEGPQCGRLAKKYGTKGPKFIPKLREGSLPQEKLHQLVRGLAEYLLRDPSLESVDIDVLSFLLYLQPSDPVLKNYVLKVLNAQGLSPAQQARLGGITPRVAEEDPLELLEQLARVMWATHQSILVLCLDQLEDIYNMERAGERFRLAMSAVTAFIDRVPSSIVVISCLEEFYKELSKTLALPVKDRLEKDPPPIDLEGQRDEKEVRDMVALRLRHYFEAFELPVDEEEPLYPFRPEDLKGLASLRSRDVLDNCRIHRERAVDAQRLPDPAFDAQETTGTPEVGNVQELQQAWNDHVRNEDFPSPEDDLARISLLGEALERSGEELDPPVRVRANAKGTHMDLLYGRKRLWIGLCNKSARGGALARELKEVVAGAAGRQIVLVRTTDWPSNPRTKICQILGGLLSKGVRRAVVEESDWRTMTAYPGFAEKHGERPEFPAWRRADRPLTSLPAVRAILGLAERTVTRAEPPAPQQGPSPGTGPAGSNGTQGATAAPHAEAAPQDAAVLGSTEGRDPRPVTLHPSELTRHAAFLGGTGSGKSTVAMVLIEQLLLAGIPALLIDRKGDLCCYADQDLRRRPAPTERAEARRGRLLDSVDVDLYTPGDPRGRALSITLVPEGTGELSSIEREQISGYAATALCRMMGYNLDTARPKSLHAILKCAIDVLAQLVPADRVTLEELVRMLDEQEPGLLNAVGKLDVKLFDKLVNDLETLRLGKGRLLESDAERLSINKLLGLGTFRQEGRTRLSILSTKFLGDEQEVLFWVAQLLIALGRWTSRNPRKDLQAVVLFDEADLYLPAGKKPATKEPMENLLRRARSAGLGILLASQNPGDFDYRCRDNIRTWCLGRIKEETSLRKMGPMLKEFREDIAARLPAQSVGRFHLVREGRVERLKADRSAVDLQQLSEERILALAR